MGGNWVGFKGMEQVKPILGIPEELDMLAILPIGYPVASIGRGKKERKSVGEVASRERFGQGYE